MYLASGTLDMVICQDCDGEGKIRGKLCVKRNCKKCDGTGKGTSQYYVILKYGI